jgi:hypothetical protein
MAAVLDSQSVKSAAKGRQRRRAGVKMKGRKMIR